MRVTLQALRHCSNRTAVTRLAISCRAAQPYIESYYGFSLLRHRRQFPKKSQGSRAEISATAISGFYRPALKNLGAGFQFRL